ncbi:YwqG family protein [Chitinophaga horti]|uniref:YwqG family protein n=1 Tax=Chitinophaga horti TaxID=2920382 RepID=A0ABY6J7S5_9BACT|nr:DUF1963 domain-containing protein [Chitinophaga horti]UYQ94352.1 YwqG family protein [Chitinophaga horti]
MSQFFEKYRTELQQLGLSTKEDLTRLVQPLLRPTTKLVVQPSMRPRQDAATRSHFGGDPYFEQGETWPASGNGAPLDFIFQVVNDGSLQLPAHIKVLQFYYDWRLAPWSTEEDGWLVKTYSDIHPDKQVKIDRPSVLPRAKYCDIHFQQTQTLPDWQSLDAFEPTASKLSCILDEDEPWAAYEATTQELGGEPQYQSQLGGYAKWLQGYDAPGDEQMQLLFQLDSEVNADISFSDQGLLYIYHHPEKPGEYFFQLQSL